MIPFLFEAVVISLSGVMAPGPLSTRTVSLGSRSAHAGAVVALGHGVVEFPLMALTLYGFGTLLQTGWVGPALGVAGGVVLAWMSLGLVRLAWRPVAVDGGAGGHRSALWTGIALTGANPYFLVWWLSVGATLLTRSTAYGTTGVLAFAVAHWLCDLVWLWLLSSAARGGHRLFGEGFSRVLYGVCGLVLCVAAVDFLVDHLPALLDGISRSR